MPGRCRPWRHLPKPETQTVAWVPEAPGGTFYYSLGDLLGQSGLGLGLSGRQARSACFVPA